ncbi:MAG TPA: hypothetical protein VIS71_08405, partial [Terrimicrobium sp.]
FSPGGFETNLVFFASPNTLRVEIVREGCTKAREWTAGVDIGDGACLLPGVRDEMDSAEGRLPRFKASGGVPHHGLWEATIRFQASGRQRRGLS